VGLQNSIPTRRSIKVPLSQESWWHSGIRHVTPKKAAKKKKQNKNPNPESVTPKSRSSSILANP
jgi:hypothetical protein